MNDRGRARLFLVIIAMLCGDVLHAQVIEFTTIDPFLDSTIVGDSPEERWLIHEAEPLDLGILSEATFQPPTANTPLSPSTSIVPRRRSRASALAQSILGTRRRRSTATSAAAFVSLASVPFMIGDTAGGSCAAVEFLGAITAKVEHPTLACSRLNISESNSPLLQNRVYGSYRHFHNVSETEINFLRNDLNIDRFTLGMERKVGDNLSLEVRVPVARELASTFEVVIDDFDPSRNTVPLSDRDGEFGNISAIAKLRLFESERFLLSGGVALQLPTADDVAAPGDLTQAFASGVVDPFFGDIFVFHDLEFEVNVKNETVNISPFLAWLWVPNNRLFHQGFLQLDVPTHPSSGRVRVAGDVVGFVANPFPPPDFIFSTPIAVDVDAPAKLHQQTLMRLNMNVGYWVYQNPSAHFLRSIAALFELHYTTTLNDANIDRHELYSYDFIIPSPSIDISLGNSANRVDVFNMVLGCASELGDTTITNGFVMPLSTGDNKAFDFEYNLQVQRLF